MPIRRINGSEWCDYCRVYFDRNKAWTPPVAAWEIVSETFSRMGNNRKLCQGCAEDVSNWQGSIWELQDQINYAIQKESKI